jgi:ATP-dependent RNA helicase UAP56/SUB2
MHDVLRHLQSQSQRDLQKVHAKKCNRNTIKKPQEILVDNQKKLTLHGLLQYYCEVSEKEKTKTLDSLLKKLQFNQTFIFCKSIERAKYLNELLEKLGHKSITIHRDMPQEKR